MAKLRWLSKMAPLPLRLMLAHAATAQPFSGRLSFFYAPRPGAWYNVGVVLKENPEAYAIMGCARRVHATLGFGFLESAYGDALEIEFRKSGIPYVREDAVRIYYDGQPLPTVWRADFTCFERRFIVELKAVKTLTKIEWAQVIHYLRATRIPYALLVNFGRPGFQYDTFDLDRLPSASVIGESQTRAPQDDATGRGCPARSGGGAVAEPL